MLLTRETDIAQNTMQSGDVTETADAIFCPSVYDVSIPAEDAAVPQSFYGPF